MKAEEIRCSRDVDLHGRYTGLLSVTASPEWWREVLVHLPDDFPGADEIARYRLAVLRSQGFKGKL